MSYIYYNPNPSGDHVEDCVVRAIAMATNQSWERTYWGVVEKGFYMYNMHPKLYLKKGGRS